MLHYHIDRDTKRKKWVLRGKRNSHRGWEVEIEFDRLHDAVKKWNELARQDLTRRKAGG